MARATARRRHRARRDASFMLARVCDRLDDPDAAFAAVATAHGLRDTPFDPDAFDRETDDLIRRFDAAWFSSAPRATIRDERPVFIVGLPRSGTSLLEQIIPSHPRAGGVGERQDPFRILEDLAVLDCLRGGKATPDCRGAAPRSCARRWPRRARSINCGIA